MKKVLGFIVLVLSLVLFTGCDILNTGDNSEDDANESLEINQEESTEKMAKLGKEDGYFVSFEYETNDNGEIDKGSMSWGIKDNVQWYIEGDGGALIKVEGETIHFYTYSDGNWEYNYSEDDEELAKTYLQAYSTAYLQWLYYANGFDGSLKKGEDTTVSGRSCYTYTFDMGGLGNLGGIVAGLVKGLKLEYKVAVDKEYGITMKLEFMGEAEGESATFSYVVKEFKTGNDVVIPTLPEPTSPEGGEE